MTAGSVDLAQKNYTVTVVSETPTRSIYHVTRNSRGGKAWRPSEVRIGVECVFACLRCKLPPNRPCIHVEIVRRFVASQPREAVDG